MQISDAQTNMVFISFHDVDVHAIASRLKEKDILITPGKRVRLVTHLDLNDQDVEYFVSEFTKALD
jgi:threonine aldolase